MTVSSARNDVAGQPPHPNLARPKSQKQVLARQREARALAARSAGATYAQIAAALGVTPAGALKILRRAVLRCIEYDEQEVDRARVLELYRLDQILRQLCHLQQQIEGQDGQPARELELRILKMQLKVQKQREMLLGLNKIAPRSSC